MSTPLTFQQQRAIEHREGSIVLTAGAGCGKTHVLTERYLSHLNEGVSVGRVVAITFTERAAREMRERIRRAVQLQRERAVAADDRARWQAHLQDLESASITTIHAFCANLLRQFALEARLDPRFEVLDDVLAGNLLQTARTTTLRQLLTSKDQPTATALHDLVVQYGWTATVQGIQELVREVDIPTWQAWLECDSHRIAEGWQRAAVQEVLPDWVHYLTSAVPKITYPLQLLRAVPCVGPLTRPDVERLLSELPTLHQAPDLDQRVRELIECAKVQKERDKAWPDNSTYEAVKKAFEGLRKELPDKLAIFMGEPADATQPVARAKQFLQVALAVRVAYQRRKQQVGVVDFQDLLVLTRDLLQNSETARTTLRTRYSYLLVDEFQDTDPVQHELVALLCGVGLEHGKLFAVGDPKQSIYRFRGAEVALFERLRGQMPPGGRLGLTVNFRSQPGILHFVNSLCHRRFGDDERLQPHLGVDSAEPNVEFLWSESEDETGRESVAAVRQREARTIAWRIRRLLNETSPRVWEAATQTFRRVRAGDIVLLFRSMSQVALYEAALREAQLDYYLVGGRAFFAQQEVYDLLNLLRTLENPQDSVSLLGTLRSPFCCLDDETILLLGGHREGLWHGLHDRELFHRLATAQQAGVKRAQRFLSRWRSLKDHLPIARLLNAVFADSGYDAAMLFEHLGERKLANLWKLQEMARSFDRSGMFGLAHFIERLGELVRDQPREEQAATLPEQADVVRLMSIHQAKGLEFPVVILADMAAENRGEQRIAPVTWDRQLGCLVRLPSDEPIDEAERHTWNHAWELGRMADRLADWREDLRILYVACTRARDLLILSAGLGTELSGPAHLPVPVKSHWLFALSEQFDLRTGESRGVYLSTLPQIQVWRRRPETLRLEAPAAQVTTRRLPNQRKPEPLPVWWPQELAIPRLVWGLTNPFPKTSPKPRRRVSQDPSGNAVASLESDQLLPAPDWPGPRDRLLPPRDPNSRIEQWFWATLIRSDLTGLPDWAPILAPVPEALREPVARRLRTLADSRWPARFADANCCWLDEAFTLGWPQDLWAGPGDPPMLEGVIDALYQDGTGVWHLVHFLLNEIGDTIPLQHALTWQAMAVQAWTGRMPHSVTLVDLFHGTEQETVGWIGEARLSFSWLRNRLIEGGSPGRIQEILDPNC